MKSNLGQTFRVFLLLAAVLAASSFLFGCGMKKSINQKNNQSQFSEQKLKSFFDNPADYKNVPSGTEKENKKIIAGIVPHHFLARSLIMNLFSKINPESIETIIVIGPDHFNKLENYIAVSKLSWETPFGDLPANQDLIERIINEDISENNRPFYNEHSIYTLMPFVKKFLPEVKVVPLIANLRYNYEKFYHLGQLMREKAGEKTMLIVSSDFTHESTISEARENNLKSIKALRELTADNISNIICDCQNCLAFALGFMGENKKFVLLDNKNSSDFEKVDQNITSYVAGYYIDEN